MDRDIRVLTLAALATTILTPILAAAQAPPQNKAPVAPKAEQLDPKACAQNGESDRATVGQGGDIDTRNPADKNLSDKLARTNGVICPPDHIDSDIRAPTPPGGAMPVIPPPGSPGGDQSVQPK
jgi:hypothetical protein